MIFLAGEKRYACKRSSFMFHGVGFDIMGQTMRFEQELPGKRLDFPASPRPAGRSGGVR